jgi:hypothetical protein
MLKTVKDACVLHETALQPSPLDLIKNLHDLGAAFFEKNYVTCKLVVLALSFFTAGCAANSGAIPLGPDTYLISRQGGGFWAMPNTLRNEALTEANQYCSSHGKFFRVVSTQMLSQIALGQSGGPRFPIAEVQFMCLDANDAELTRPRSHKESDVVIEKRIDNKITIEHK